MPKKKRPSKPKAASRAKKVVRKLLRRDTPVDVPAIVPAPRPKPASLIERLNSGEEAQAASSAGDSALARIAVIETLEEAYDAWLELKVEHAQVQARYAQEKDKLEREGAFLLGAVRAAGPLAGVTGNELLAKDPLAHLAEEAEQKLVHARAVLDKEIEVQEQAFAAAFAKVKAEIRARVERYAEKVRVPLKLFIRPVGTTRNILHLERLAPDEALLLLYSVHGTIPTRHGYLFDDSTDDVSQAPPPLYSDEGVKNVRPNAKELRALVEAPNQSALPLKGFIPLFVPKPGGGADFFRLLQRGAVMEVELQEGEAFRNVLTREEAERLAGHLLRLKLGGRAELEIVAG